MTDERTQDERRKSLLGRRASDRAVAGVTKVFMALTLVLTGVVAFQFVEARRFTDRTFERCEQITAYQTAQAALIAKQESAYTEFIEQERTNEFIDSELRAKRIQTWAGLQKKANAVGEKFADIQPPDCRLLR